MIKNLLKINLILPFHQPSRSSTTNRNQTSQSQTQPSTPSDSVSSTNNVLSIETDNDDNENTDNTNTNAKDRRPTPTVGARVRAMYQGACRPGKILSVNDKRALFKMRFDEFPTAEFDYSFSYKSPAWSYITTPPPLSSSSATTTTETNDNEPIFSIARKFKALIKVKIFLRKIRLF